MRKHYLLLLLVLHLLSCSNLLQEEATPVFRLLNPSVTGIDFNNIIPDDVQYSVISYEYAYNGSGVAIGDVNNDGLEDVFFGGNIASSRLYLNKGSLRFEDITLKAKVGTKAWISGVSMVDINNDGWLDIYLCVSGDVAEQDRANLLFINNHDLTFTEAAAEYGLADTSFSTQAAFFDFDRDGYLDCYLMNHSNADRDASYLMPINKSGSAKSTDKLYRNLGNGQFKDVSAQAGITVEGYGLGVIVQDFNRDGWPDVFVSNDYIYNDLLYINNTNGTFTESAKEYFPYNSQFAMGVDVGDINRDGFFDLMQLDMLPPDNKRKKLLAGAPNYKRFEMASQLGYTDQFMRNTLHLGTKNQHFNEIGIYAGVAATDWSWSVLIQDFDNDGHEDIHITNGYLKNITDLDFAAYSNLQKGARVAQGQFREKVKEAIRKLEGAKLSNYVFQNSGSLQFKEQNKAWGIEIPSFSNGAAYADLDNDGDLELVVSNINDPAFVYENQTNNGKSLSVQLRGNETNSFAEGATVVLNLQKGKKLVKTKTSTRGYLSSVTQNVFFGLEENDSVQSVVVHWPDGIIREYNLNEHQQTITLKYDEGHSAPDSIVQSRVAFDYSLQSVNTVSPIYSHKSRSSDFDYQILLPKYYSRKGPFFAYADINNDGLEDLYYGGNAVQAGKIMLQTSEANFEVHQELDLGFQDGESAFIDLNGDKLLDLLVVSSGYSLFPQDFKLSNRIYLNDGKGKFIRDFSLFPKIQENQHALAIADFQKKGRASIFIGGHVYPMKFPLPAKSSLLILENDKYTDIAGEIEGFERMGIVTDAIWTDIDADGWQDLAVVGEWMEPQFFKNNKGKLAPWKVDWGSESISGHWNVIKAHDFNKDGLQDFFLGNIGMNSAFSGSANTPLKIFANDFDKNGSIDPIITYSDAGIDYPFAARDLYMQQLPYLKKKFVNYESFSEATLKDIFDESTLEESFQLQINYSESIILKNLGNDAFEIVQLPLEANLNWINDVLIDDVDKDGLVDILLCGNQNNMEVSYGHVIGDFLLLLKATSPFQFETAALKVDKIVPLTSTSQISKVKLGKAQTFSISFTADTLRFYSLKKMSDN